MNANTTYKRQLILISVTFFLAIGLLTGCSRENKEQAATNQNQAETQQQATVNQNQSQQTAQSGSEGSMVGRQVVSNDGHVLGTVAEMQPSIEGSGYVMIKGGNDRLHPVPTNMLSQGTQQGMLTASFDQTTFQKSPSFSEAQQDQLNDSQLQEVRGYYENKAYMMNQQMPAAAPQPQKKQAPND